MFSGAVIELKGERIPIVMLSPLAVVPEFQKRGIGSALVRDVTAEADRRGHPFVILEGSPVYYGRFGCVPMTPRCGAASSIRPRSTRPSSTDGDGHVTGVIRISCATEMTTLPSRSRIAPRNRPRPPAFTSECTS